MAKEEAPRSVISRLFSRESFNPNWKPEFGKSACPPKKDKGKTEIPEEPQSAQTPVETMPDNRASPCPKKPPYIPPSKICPPSEQCCYIKMQDPKAPCCSDLKTVLPPCPPKPYPKEPRQPVCECDRCKQRGGKCCENGFRRTNVDPRQFQEA